MSEETEVSEYLGAVKTWHDVRCSDR